MVVALLTYDQATELQIPIDQIENVAAWNIKEAKEAGARKDTKRSKHLMDQGKHLERLATSMRERIASEPSDAS